MGRRRRLKDSSERLNPATARIAIVGSGLAGLSAAIALEQAGFQKVALYERDVSLEARKEGYGLTLTYNPAGVLKRLGVLNQLADHDCPSRSHYLFQSNGEITGYFGNAFSSDRGFGQRGNLRVPRQRVRRLLLEKLVHAKVHWDHKLTGVTSKEPSLVLLHFGEGRTVEADLVIAADGIRSSVVQEWLPQIPTPQPLGIRIILGLTCNFEHPVVRERGFYTLDRGKRLFVMPFSGSNLDPTIPIRYMWQLSFASSDESSYSSEVLQRQALEQTTGWHAPVQAMIRSTPCESIWGTQLRDRDPTLIMEALSQGVCRRVLVVGDALHAMSPFKGQGANQSLQDGLVLSKWLTRASTESAVQSAMREIVQRTAPVVIASREAALFWHSANALEEEHLFAGVAKENASSLVRDLRLASISAETERLDERVSKVIDAGDYRMKSDTDSEESVCVDVAIRDAALAAARQGDLGTLREQSWSQPNSIFRSIQEPTTCLHAAAAAGHARTVHWLLAEAGCSPRVLNECGESALDVAGSEEVREVLRIFLNNPVL